MLTVIEHDLISSMVYEKNFVNVNKKEIKRDNGFKNIGNVKEIPDFPNYYVSDQGKVYSDMKGKTIELKAIKRNKDLDYLCVCLYKEGKHYLKQIHRLVLSTFKPISDMSSYQVNHKDEDPTNNRLENLEWCTAKYNTNYGTRNERAGKAMKGRRCPWRSKKVLQYDTNYNLIASYDSSREAAKAFGVVHSTISNYCHNLKLYKNKYYFQYESK